MAKKIPEPDTIQTAAAPVEAAAAPVPKIKAETDQICSAGFYCYIGPSIKGVIQTGTVYCGSRNDALRAAAKAIETYPVIKTLIVSGDSLPGALRKLNDPGSGLYARFQQLAGKA